MDAFITLISFPVLFQSSATGARQRVDNKLETCMHSTTSLMSTRDRIGAILRVTSGNFLEQFDFFPVRVLCHLHRTYLFSGEQ
ncbi:major facilitator superfamily permease [Klebsiella variicola]|uniref:Major facilitator superfamily permease n=1 Tax=Klebsiella variicola TaxID=244366 RepID=A0A7H4MMM7_KLEVA|nr:major facilitator superfamily permease [Klebsiella variicola]